MKKKNLIYFFILAIFGLAPVLWFRPGMLVKTADLRLPLNFWQWKQLFFMWNDTLGTGAERLLDISLILFWFPSALLSKFGVSIAGVQKALFVFWFMITAFSSFFMLSKLLEGKFRYPAALAAVSFYVYNLWVESFWIAFKPPLAAGYGFLPIALLLIILTFERKLNYIKSAFYLGLVSLAASSIGNNPSEFLGICLPLAIVFMFYFIKQKSWRDKTSLFFFIKFCCLSLFVFAAFNLFWLAAQGMALWENISLNAYVCDKGDSLNWLKGLSYYTNFLNVVRLMGDWTWYAGCVDMYRDYSPFYRSNVFFIILSYLAPFLALTGFVISRNKHRILFFVMAVTGIILSMGAHFPFEKSYLWMVRNIPLFWIIRSPYYKFGLLICLGYAFLMAEAVQKLCLYVSNVKTRKYAYLLVIVIIILNILYGFPVSLGKMFHTKDKRTFLAADHIKIPAYVYEAVKWVDCEAAGRGLFRIYALPGDSPWITKWDYVGFGSAIANFTKRPVVFKYDPAYILYSQGAVNQSGRLVRLCEKSIYEELSLNTAKILSMLNIKYILQENDVRYDFYSVEGFAADDSPEFMRARLNRQENICFERSFGEWDFYRVNQELPFIYAMPKINLVAGDINVLTALSNTDFWDNPAFMFTPLEDTSLTAADGDLDEMETELLSRGLIQKVILCDDNKKTERLWSFLKDDIKDDFEYIFATEDMKPKVIIDEELSLKQQGFSEPEMLFNEKQWRWLVATSGEPNLIINNPAGAEKYVNLRFLIYSYGRPRSLGIYVNKKLIKSYQVPLEEITEINLKEIRLEPGENSIVFETPYEWDIRNGMKVRFAFSKFEIGSYKFNKEFVLPESGQYILRIYPAPRAKPRPCVQELGKERGFTGSGVYCAPVFKEETAQIQKEVMLNGSELRLNMEQEKKVFVSEELTLSRGINSIEIAQEGKENYYIEIAPLNFEKEMVVQKSAINFEKINPSLYKVTADIPAPFFLIFSESYDKGWSASVNGRAVKTHLKINGYANCWLIDKLDENDIIMLAYLPQRTFYLSALISIVSVISASGGILIFNKVLK